MSEKIVVVTGAMPGGRTRERGLDAEQQWVITTIEADGSGIRHDRRGVHRSFSPDGTRILYMAPGPVPQIRMMRSDGSADECLTCRSRPRRPDC